jgi:F0F1-type ATP synthase epsilon subunit
MKNGGRLVLQIITPDGRSLKESQIDAVVFRRRERRFELGSEIAIFPGHAPLLIRIPVAPVRYRKASRTCHVAVGGGFVEVRNNQVMVVTPRFERIGTAAPHPWETARAITEQWRREHKEFQREMVGYL